MKEHLYAVGQIFYATAICDGEMRPVEEDKLIESYNSYWQDLTSTINRGEDSIPMADEILEDIMLQRLDPLNYFENFKEHYQKHPQEFIPERKNLIMKSINDIASSYAKQNKSEIILVAKTRLLLSPV